MNRFDIQYQLYLESPRIFCGAGAGRAGIDRTFVRDARNRMVIPGSHIKGVVRQCCEDLLATLGAPSPDTHDHEALEKDTGLIARTFGRPGPEDITCVFADVIPDEEKSQPVDVRKRIRINRRLGRPEHGALFDSEYAAVVPGDILHGSVTLWTTADEKTIPVELSLLCAGLRLVDCLGGDKSSGAGAVDIRVTTIQGIRGRLELREVLQPVAAGNLEGGAP
jgi:CRISPR/Cas system CSM-associated protein Csm3 (group 7 of RAMP superfamily)